MYYIAYNAFVKYLFSLLNSLYCLSIGFVIIVLNAEIKSSNYVSLGTTII